MTPITWLSASVSSFLEHTSSSSGLIDSTVGTDTNSERHEGRAYDSHETAKGSAAALALWGTRTAWRDPKQWSRLDKTRTTVMDICTRYGLRALEEACHVPAAYTQLEPLDHPDWEFPSRYQISLRSTTEDITSSSLTVTANRGAESLSPQALVSDSSEPFSSSACSSSETATASARDLAVPAGLSSEGGQAPANAMAAPVDANSKCQAPEKVSFNSRYYYLFQALCS